jgi:drug/metabolite transporter (DMT)-like permease
MPFVSLEQVGSSRRRLVRAICILRRRSIEERPHVSNAPIAQPASPGADIASAAAALVTVTLWGSAFVGIRAAGAEISPGVLAFGRLLVASAALGIAVAVVRPSMPRGRDLVLVAAAGVLWFGLYNLALNTAEQQIDAGTAALLVSVAPLLIIVFAGFILGDGFPRRLVIGASIAFAGAATIGLATTDAAGNDDVVAGIALCLVAAVLYASGVTIQKPLLGRVPGLTITWLGCCVGAVVALPFGTRLIATLQSASPASVAWLVYLGLFPTSVAFLTWAFALRRSTAGRLASTTYLVAPASVGLGWLLLGEAPLAGAIAGGLLAIIGVAIARSGPTRR